MRCILIFSKNGDPYYKVKTPENRKSFATETGISHSVLLKLTKPTDLSRIRWVGVMFARILYESGFDTLEKVANADYIQLIPLEKGNMSKKTFTEDQIRLARIARALGHPVRIAILQMLANQSCCYHGDMSEVIPVAKSTLSQHLNELKEAGLIQGEITPPTVKYCINKENWTAVRKLLGGFIDRVAKVDSYC